MTRKEAKHCKSCKTKCHTLNVYRMNSCDWWADYSLEEAKINYLKFCGSSVNDAFDEDNPPYQLILDEMNTLMFAPDPYNEPNVKVRSFFQELKKQVIEGNTKPFLFASTEY